MITSLFLLFKKWYACELQDAFLTSRLVGWVLWKWYWYFVKVSCLYVKKQPRLFRRFWRCAKSCLDVVEGSMCCQSTSIAGVAMLVYRRCFLKPDMVSVVPEKGYERHDKASDIAIKPNGMAFIPFSEQQKPYLVSGSIDDRRAWPHPQC